MKHARRAFYLQMAGLLLAAAVGAWVVRSFPVVDRIAEAQREISEMGVWGAVLYPILFGLCNVLLLPAGILCVGSGLFFGLWWGFALNAVGNVFGAAIAFWLSRWFGRGWITRQLLVRPKWAALDAGISREGWKIIFLSQLHPLFPSSLINYLYGVTQIRFWTCMLWVGLGRAPGLFLYAYFGTLAQYGIRLWKGESDPAPHEYVLWIGGLVLTIATTIALGRIALRLLDEAHQAETAARARKAAAEQPEEVPQTAEV